MSDQNLIAGFILANIEKSGITQINIDHIVTISPCGRWGTWIHLSTGSCLVSVDSYDEIAERIADQRGY